MQLQIQSNQIIATAKFMFGLIGNERDKNGKRKREEKKWRKNEDFDVIIQR